MPHSGGAPVASDWTDKAPNDPVFGLYKRCGFWTFDEAQILHRCALQVPGDWLDIGSHTGWTTAHIAAVEGCHVVAIDPMYRVPEFLARAEENLTACGVRDQVTLSLATSNEYFAIHSPHGARFAGICIDGDHEPPCPVTDARNAHTWLQQRGVVLFHDAKGQPVVDGFRWLAAQGYRMKYYPTVHGVAVCWRSDEFTPPEI